MITWSLIIKTSEKKKLKKNRPNDQNMILRKVM